jgi:hypothetical protein
MPKVSVIIIDYKIDLAPCLESLKAQTYQDFEIIVVDNNKNNRGFAAGCNEGIRKAKGEYIALLNNDARANKHWLAALMLAAHSHRDCSMFASTIIRPDGSIESAGCHVYPDGNGMCNRVLLSRVYFPSGCAALYSRSMLNEIGLFDESFFMYNEDTELGIRAKTAGYKCLYVPSAVVTHQGSKHTLKKLYYVERNRIKIMLKHFTFWQILKSVPWTIIRYTEGGR